MSEKPERIAPAPSEPSGDDQATTGDDRDAESSAMRALLKKSLGRDEAEAPDLLAGVQRRIRARSRGKFYNDGWSTTHARANYALIGVLTLLLALVAYYMMSPTAMR
ncbi:MAG TPA: hypothetical protein VHV30_09595 [Polyangiaceae bacterium]|jgi:hypothetical protein|nr:hypothetical protein [Polyangiaceae bacterium]